MIEKIVKRRFSFRFSLFMHESNCLEIFYLVIFLSLSINEDFYHIENGS